MLKVTKPLLKGSDVKAVQAALIAAGFHCGKDSTEGIYGKDTAYAVRLFQSANGLVVNGRIAEQAARVLGASFELTKNT